MEIYAAFRGEKYIGAMRKGSSYEEKEDAKWEQGMNFFRSQGVSELKQISEEDYKLYKKGYTRSEEGTPIAPEPIVKTTQEQLQDIQTQFISELQELRQEYVNAQMAGIDTTPIQKTYTELVESSNEKAIKVIENGE